MKSMSAIARRVALGAPTARLAHMGGMHTARCPAAWRTATRALCQKGGTTTAADGDKEPTVDESESDAGLRERLLAAALKEVPTHGWSVAALSAGAVSCGLSATAHGALPDGPIELVRYFNAQSDDALRAELAARASELAQLDVHDRLIVAMEARLKLLEPYAATWPQVRSR